MADLDLTDFFQTKAQAQDFSLRLAAISEKLYETNFNLEKSLSEQFGIKKKDAFISLLRNNNTNPENVTALITIFSKIQDQIATLPVITLTLAIEPNEEIMKALSNWFLLNLKKHVLFDFRVDTHLIAGTVLTYGGKYLDFSLKPILDEVLKKELNPELKRTNSQIDYRKYNATPFNSAQAAVHTA